MKTKIIYISGNEMFDMRDIRAALEEVRTTLSLDNDTILFGIPVDKDDALETQNGSEIISETPAPESMETPVDIAAEISDEIDEKIEIEPTTPVKKSRGRPRTKSIEPADEIITPMPDINPQENDSESVAGDTPVVPILSVLAGGKLSDDEATTDTDIDTDKAPDASESPVSESVLTDDPIDETAIDEMIVEPDTDVKSVITEETLIIATSPDAMATVSVTVDDLVTNDAPIEPATKTLEDLLESMSPLREDDEIVSSDEYVEPEIESDEINADDAPVIDDDGSDATLEQLAAEFAQTQDKIPEPAPVQKQGRLGKFKNVLPFKKLKRDDGGLMGDLFGWAGIAANDDGFEMPDFFQSAASKK